jgi:hypothetical protein
VGDVATAVDLALAESGVAHSGQNLAVGGLVVPHVGQTWPSGVAHSMQKRAPAAFSVPQFGQITAASVRTTRLAAQRP